MYRVEDKYVVSNNEIELFEKKLNPIMEIDNNSSSYYRITSLYFDSYSNTNLYDSEDGIAERKKYRIRIYNNSLNTIKLEVKYKRYNRVYKISETITKEEALSLMNGKCILDNKYSFDSAITLFNLAIKQELLKPKIIVDYMRKAYINSFGNVRITFDKNIGYSNDIKKFLLNSCKYKELYDINKILEIKYNELLPEYIHNILENGKMNQISYSKYRLCMEELEETKYVY